MHMIEGAQNENITQTHGTLNGNDLVKLSDVLDMEGTETLENLYYEFSATFFTWFLPNGGMNRVRTYCTVNTRVTLELRC